MFFFALLLFLPLSGCGGDGNTEPSPPPLIIFTTALPGGTVGVAYDFTLQSIGGTGGLNWSVTNDSLPEGLTLNATTGVISGTPTAEGSSTLTITLTSGEQTTARALTLIIGTVPDNTLKVFTTVLPTGTIGMAYSFTLQATGGTGEFSWTVSNGALPDGLTLAEPTGVISGTPTIEGVSPFTVTVTSGNQTASRDLSIQIFPDGDPTLQILTLGLPDTTVEFAYSVVLRATGGTGIFDWTIINGSLPDGLELDQQTGAITGTPTVINTFTFTINVQSGDQDKTQDYTIRVGPAENPQVELFSLASDGAQANGGSGSASLSPDGRFVAFTSFADNLSANDTNNSTDIFIRDRVCQITELVSLSNEGIQGNTASFLPSLSALRSTPSGNILFVAYASNATNLRGSLNIGITSLPDGVTGEAYSQPLDTTGGATPYTFSLSSGALPDGLALDTTTGEISGAPTTVGTFDFEITVVDSSAPQQRDRQTFTVNITDPPALTAPAMIVEDVDSNAVTDIYLTAVRHDAAACTLTPLHTARVSVASDGTEGNRASTLPFITPDGRFVIYQSQATNLAAGDDNNATDVFLTEMDFSAGVLSPLETTLVSIFQHLSNLSSDLFSATSIGNSGLSLTEGTHTGRKVEITSGTGQGQIRIITENDFTTLTVQPAWDTLPDTSSIFRVFSSSFSTSNRGRISADGNFLAFTAVSGFSGGDSSSGPGAYTQDRLTNNSALSSIASDGTPGSGSSNVSALSDSGNLVLFSSTANNLIAEDSNLARDLFLHNRATGETIRVHLPNDGSEADGPIGGTENFRPFESSGMSSSGRLIVYESSATNLDGDDFNNRRDVFLYDQSANVTRKISLGLDAVEALGESFDVAISLDGSTVVFTSEAPNLVANDTNKINDLFLISTGVTESPVFITASLASAALGAPYGENLLAVGGTAPLHYSIAGGELPPGIGLDSRSGRLQGVPVRPGRYRFTVVVQDSARPGKFTTRMFDLVVAGNN